MNHFAHLYLAQPTVESRVGNLLGDFARGVDAKSLSVGLQNGLANHRAVDAFTDRHPLVREAKKLFSSQRRRFAGVALDVLFDHYLIRHWSALGEQELEGFTAALYRDLKRGRDLMPSPMQRVTGSIVEHDWFGSYASLDNVGHALDRVAARIRFPNRFAGVIEEIQEHDHQLEAVFLAFFPQLVDHVHAQALERHNGITVDLSRIYK